MVEITDGTVSFLCPIVMQDVHGEVELCKKPITATPVAGKDDFDFVGECQHAKSGNLAIHHRLCMEVDWIRRAFEQEIAKEESRSVEKRLAVQRPKEREPEEPRDL